MNDRYSDDAKLKILTNVVEGGDTIGAINEGNIPQNYFSGVL